VYIRAESGGWHMEAAKGWRRLRAGCVRRPLLLRVAAPAPPPESALGRSAEWCAMQPLQNPSLTVRKTVEKN